MVVVVIEAMLVPVLEAIVPMLVHVLAHDRG